jgi:hypothetical protein
MNEITFESKNEMPVIVGQKMKRCQQKSINLLVSGECQGMTKSGNWIFLSAADVATDFLHFSNFDIIYLSKGFVSD